MAQVDIGKIKIVWKGPWNSGTSYTVDDAVSHSGNSYICIQAGTNQNPSSATAYWQIMVSAGTNGADADLLNISGTVQGDIYYNNGSAIARLAPGVANQVLKTGGASANPSWGDSGGLTLKKHSFFHNDQFSTIGSSGQLVLTQPYTTKGTNSIFLLDASIFMGFGANINSDVHNVSIFAFLEDSSSNYYRFGFYKSSGVYAGNTSSLSGNYWLEDCDGTSSFDNNWNSLRRSFSDVGGNQTSDQTNYVASTFAAGTSLNLKVYLADGGGSNLYYNRCGAGSTQNGRSFYSITELKGFE